MTNRFTAKAEQVLECANREARLLGHSYIGSEHILLGLSLVLDSVASKILMGRGVEPKGIKEKITSISGVGVPSCVGGSDMTPRCKRIIERGAMEARKRSFAYIGTEHLLYALLGEKDSVAARIIEGCGASVSDLKNDLGAYFSAVSEGTSSRSGIASSQKEKDERQKISGAPTLSSYGRDLTHLAKEGRTDPVIGREEEIERVIRILSRRTKNNPCLVGEPGVGKTAVVEGLAALISESEVPDSLIGCRIITLDIASMIAGAKYRGEFEERMRAVIDEVSKSEDIILFIDEIHTMIGAGAAEGAVDAANILKPALARGEIRLIGATTLDEYRAHIEKDAALERRFQAVSIGEPDEESAIRILYGLRDRYEAHHALRISDEAIRAAVRLSVRYIPDRYLPDKAIDLIDEAASMIRIKRAGSSPEIKSAQRRLSLLESEKESAIIDQDFLLAASLRDEEKNLRDKIDELSNGLCESESPSVVGEEDIAEIVKTWTSVPVGRLIEDEGARLISLEEELSNRVVGQKEAISAVSRAIRRGRVGLKEEGRPIGSFIFLGKTGVGKTELVKALAQVLFGTQSAMIRLDMSEFMERHSVSKLIGSPPGYVGYGEGGQLTERVRRRPYSVVLLDEIEKAHPDVYDLLLQILDEGVLCDSQGRRVDFRNTVIVMTSNVGAKEAVNVRSLGFNPSSKDDVEQQKRSMLSALKREFKPEFLGRVDEIIVFDPLSEDDLEKIAASMLCELEKRAKSIGLGVSFDESVARTLAQKSFDGAYGARPLRRAITKEIEDVISEKLLLGKLEKNKRLTVSYKNGELCFELRE